RVASSCKATVEIFWVVVSEADEGRAGEPAAVINAGMAVRVDKYCVLRPNEPGNHGEIRLVAGSENDARSLAQKPREVLLQCVVNLIGAVRYSRAGCASSVRAERGLGCSNAGGIKSQAEIVVGAS